MSDKKMTFVVVALALALSKGVVRADGGEGIAKDPSVIPTTPAPVMPVQQEDVIAKAYPIMYFVEVKGRIKQTADGLPVFNKKGRCTQSKTVGYLYKADLDYAVSEKWVVIPPELKDKQWIPSQLRKFGNAVKKEKQELNDRTIELAQSLREKYQKRYPEKVKTGTNARFPAVLEDSPLESYSCETLADVLAKQSKGTFQELKSGNILLVKEGFTTKKEISLHKLDNLFRRLMSASQGDFVGFGTVALEEFLGQEVADTFLQTIPEEESSDPQNLK